MTKGRLRLLRPSSSSAALQAGKLTVASRHQASPRFQALRSLHTAYHTMASDRPEAMKGITVQVSAEPLEEALLVKVFIYLDDIVLLVVGNHERHPSIQE